jgi:hypothetical protein
MACLPFSRNANRGTFDYKLDFKFNKKQPDQLVFDSNLRKENLKITKYGEANLTKLNGSSYTAIIKEVLQRPVLVGLSNPNYTPIDQISPYLKMCFNYRRLLLSSHHGFINEAFRQSIVKNIKTKNSHAAPVPSACN